MVASIYASYTIATFASGYKIVISQALGLSQIYQHSASWVLRAFAPSADESDTNPGHVI